ncbi:MAG: hypothetical protein V1745_04955 [Patescibacteria group bacterium]
MGILLVRETVRSNETLRKKRNVECHASDNLVRLMEALQNIEAEFGYVHGISLVDDDGDELPCIINACFSRSDQLEVLEATRAMWGFFVGPKMNCRMSEPFLGTAARSWDLDRLRQVFDAAFVHARDIIRNETALIMDPTGIIDRRFDATVSSARATCLASAFSLLALECTVLKERFRHRPATAAIA